MVSNGMKRRVHGAARRTFRFWESLGVHVMPVGFDSPIRETERLSNDLFERRYACVGVDWDDLTQLDLLRTVFPRFLAERDFASNPGLSRGDAAALYAMVRERKPAKVIEAGSGYSTTFLASACRRNAEEGSPVEYVAYDPYPGPMVSAGVEGLTALRPIPIQDVPVTEFDDCDLLFIDSSHVVSIGSDVTFLVLEVLPRLRPGTLVHFHDILLPAEYWKEWVLERQHYWSEQYLVLAFLQFNSAFKVRWAAHYLQLEHEAELVAHLPVFDPQAHRLSSLWIERVG